MIIILFITGGIIFVLRKKNNTYESIYNKGVDLHIKEKLEEAKKYFDQAINLDPTRFEAYYNLALSYLTEKEWDKAEEYFLTVIEINKEDSDSFYNLGLIEYERKNFNKAIGYYEKALNLNNNDTDCLYNKGITYLALNDYNQAITFLLEAIKLNDNPLYKMGIANAYDKKSDKTASPDDIKFAIEAYKEVILNEPENEEALFRLAVCYAKNGAWEDSVYYCERIIKINPSSADAYNQHGLAIYCKGDINEAIKLYSIALSLDKTNPIFYTNLAFAYEKVDEQEKAIEIFNKFLIKFPTDEKAKQIKEHLITLR
jgi:tetratricopeptide (TPR) repeat protein